MWEIVEELKREGVTILLTTHYMEEAERLADEVVIIDHGRKIAEGTPAAIIASLGAESIVELLPREDGNGALDDEVLRALPGVREVRHEGAAVTLAVTDTQACVGALLPLLDRDRSGAGRPPHAPTDARGRVRGPDREAPAG